MALIYAIEGHYIEIVKYLIDQGVDVNVSEEHVRKLNFVGNY